MLKNKTNWFVRMINIILGEEKIIESDYVTLYHGTKLAVRIDKFLLAEHPKIGCVKPESLTVELIEGLGLGTECYREFNRTIVTIVSPEA